MIWNFFDRRYSRWNGGAFCEKSLFEWRCLACFDTMCFLNWECMLRNVWINQPIVYHLEVTLTLPYKQHYFVCVETVRSNHNAWWCASSQIVYGVVKSNLYNIITLWYYSWNVYLRERNLIAMSDVNKL